jgi:hypothetical protein
VRPSADSVLFDLDGTPFLFVDYGFGACPDVALRFSSFAQRTDWLLT